MIRTDQTSSMTKIPNRKYFNKRQYLILKYRASKMRKMSANEYNEGI